MNSTRDDSRFDEWLTKINQHSFDSLKSNSLQVAGEEARTSNKKSRSMQDQEASLRRLAENHEAEESTYHYKSESWLIKTDNCIFLPHQDQLYDVRKEQS